MIQTPAGETRPLAAEEREVLMGFERGHTARMLKKTPGNLAEYQAAEDVRCAALGNSFHVTTVAILFDAALATLGVKEAKGVEEIARAHHHRSRPGRCVVKEEVPADTGGAGLAEAAHGPERLEEWDDGVSEAGQGLMERLTEDMLYVPDVQQMIEHDRGLSARLVAAFARRQEFRGCDVRLDLGSLYRPDSFSRGSINPSRWNWHGGQGYPFTIPEHINILEMRALINALKWRLRSSSFGDCRALHLVDSQVVLAVAVKGRSSSRILNKLLRQYAALQISGGVQPVLGWVESEDNPADEPSRRDA